MGCLSEIFKHIQENILKKIRVLPLDPLLQDILLPTQILHYWFSLLWCSVNLPYAGLQNWKLKHCAQHWVLHCLKKERYANWGRKGSPSRPFSEEGKTHNLWAISSGLLSCIFKLITLLKTWVIYKIAGSSY